MAAESAVLYTRSSKDTHDVSPAAQRTELKAYAARKGLRVVADFSDAAISANADPPQLAALLRELKNPARKWTVVLAVDSSRLARDADLAGVISFQVRKAACRIEFAKQPSSGNAGMDVIISAVARAWDQYHSMISKEKGLQGMRTNVELGHRAGGRAPIGYRLEHVKTGTVRNGEPVRKSHLVLDPDKAPKVKRYLRVRSGGAPRVVAAAECGLKLPSTTWIGIERNALAYAGHTVWNRHSDRKDQRYNPRSEWVIQRDTHPAMITEEQAEQLMKVSMPREERRRRGPSGKHLLTGFLFTPKGESMVANGDGYYRAGKGKRIPAAALEEALLKSIDEEREMDGFLEGFVAELRKAAKSLATDPGELEKDLKRVERAIDSLVRLAEEAPDSRAVAERLNALEAEKAAIQDSISRAAQNAAVAKALAATTPKQARHWLKAWSDVGGATVEERREALGSFVERIVLDPETGTGRVHYRWRGREPGDFRLPSGAKLASPPRFELGLSP